MKKRVLIITGILGFFACLSFSACEHEHSLVKYDSKEATCLEDGYIEYWECSTCGKRFGDSDGTQELTDDEIGRKAGHHYDDWHISYPRLNDAGHAVRICANCDESTAGHTQSVVLPALTDSQYLITENTATCISLGMAKYSITLPEGTICFEAVSDIDPDKHFLYAHEGKAATCISEGNSAYWQCADCRKYFSNEACTIQIQKGDWVIPVSSHKYGEWEISVPTFHDEGAAVRVCSVCHEGIDGHSQSVVLPALTEKQYLITEDTATCISSGTAKYTIHLSERTFRFEAESAINPDNHNLQVHILQEATCVRDGNLEYSECTLCHKYFLGDDCTAEIQEGEWMIPATEHDWRWQSLNATEHYYPICSNCGESRSLREEHTFVDGICECGVKRRQYTDEDNPEGLIVVIDMPEDYSSNRFIYVTLPYITVGQDRPIIDIRVVPSRIYEAGTDEQYGTLWSAILSINEHYNLRFYCDFENGDTFKLYSVCRSLSWRWDIDGDSFRFYVWQSYYETTFGMEKYTYQGLTFVRLDGSLPPAFFDVGGEVDPSPRPKWQILILEVAGREQGFCFYFTYDEDGWITGVRLEHYHIYYSFGVAVTCPTTTEEGVGVKLCMNCDFDTEGHIVYVTLPPLTDERYILLESTAATCEEDGTAWYQITLDGFTFEFAVDIPATGHDWANWRISDRDHYATCNVCRKVSELEEHEFVDGECKCGMIRREFRDADGPEGLIVLAHIARPYPEYLFLTISLPYITAEDGRNFTNIRIRRSELIEVETDERYGTLWAMQVSWGGVVYGLKFYCDFENGDTFKLHSINRSLYWGMDLEDHTLRFYVWQSYYETTFGVEKYSYQRLRLSIDGGSFFDVVGETDSSPRPEWLRFTIEVGGEEKELYFYFSYDEDGRVSGITGEEQ